MNTPAPLDIKVIYSATKRHRRGWWASRAAVPIQDTGLVVLGILNVIAAGGLYYATCWWADPELRFRVLMHTPLPGVDLREAKLPSASPPTGEEAQPIWIISEVAKQQGRLPPDLVPDSAEAPRDLTANARAQTAQAVKFVGTVVGWEALATIAACALALAGGALVGRAGTAGLRLAGVVVALVGLVAIGWAAYDLWVQYGRLVPDQLRTDIGGLVLLAALAGLVIGRRIRGLTYLAAIILILSAAGSVVGLYVGAQFDAVKPEELPLPFFAFVVVVFVIHSLWGWVLLLLASRIRPY
ncbi:MAG: hypothetical protein JSU86_12965 [Phycisphaerales bacterium]|nr:MAG: hypothetical protein JSU86_12965 [Phycisphaerales bacterium]